MVKTPETKEDWAAAFAEMAEERSSKWAVSIASLGLDPVGFGQWAADDAVDSMQNTIPALMANGTPGPEAVGAALAGHTQLGIEMGIWLVKTGRVVL